MFYRESDYVLESGATVREIGAPGRPNPWVLLGGVVAGVGDDEESVALDVEGGAGLEGLAAANFNIPRADALG